MNIAQSPRIHSSTAAPIKPHIAQLIKQRHNGVELVQPLCALHRSVTKLHMQSKGTKERNSRLDKLALIDGFWDIHPPHRVEALSGNWRADVRWFTDTHGQQIVYDESDISILLSEEKRTGLRTFFVTQSIAACSSIGLSTKPIIQITSVLTICLLSDAIPTGD